MAQQFKEYPKLLKHPQYKAAQWKTLEGKGVGLFAPDTICTSPERFPDVTVTTKEQEQYYAARGYRPTNMANPVEYEQAILESAPVEGYGFQEFPKWKYHAIEMPELVKSKDEEAALGDGWGDAPIIATEDDLEEYMAQQSGEHPVEKTPDPVAATTKPKVDGRSKAARAQRA